MADKTLKGLTKTLRALEKFGIEADKGVDAIAEATANDIGADAKTNAPKNLGKLAQSISSPAIKLSDSNYKVSVTANYAGYVEFGTGAKVSIPAEMQELASRLRGEKGTFEEGLQSIRDWCRSRGIELSAAYPIFISILKKGIEPQPFLYPAFLKGRKNYLKDLNRFLNDLTKKYE